MITTVNQELRDLIRPLDFISPEDAITAARAVAERLKTIFEAYIVDIFWKKNGSNGPYVLEPFVSLRSESVDPAGLIIISDKKGILPWVQDNGKVAWIDEVKSKDWTQPVLNLAALDGIRLDKQLPGNVESIDENDSKYIEPSPNINSFSLKTECILAYPLKYRNQIWGVLSLEFTTPKAFDPKINSELITTARLLATLLWKADIQRQNSADTKEAVEGFIKVLSQAEEKAVPLTSFPSAFLARPFDKEGVFDKVERAIQNCIPHVEITHYKDQGKNFIIHEIRLCIQRSHFCIVDITGNNANVMIELGMMMADGDKHDKIIILHNDNGGVKIPFDINQHPVYFYTLENGKLLVKDAAGGPENLFKPILEDLVDKYVRKTE